MLIAEIRRKLNALTSDDLAPSDLRRLLSDTKEDLLTADVFGSLKYLPRVPYLSEVLTAIFAPSREWSVWFSKAAKGGISGATFEFWPRYPSPPELAGGHTEPDVVLSTPDFVIFFEMKLHSGLGEQQIERQLAIALKEARGRKAFVVTVTNGLRTPGFKGGPDKTFVGCVRAARASGQISSELAAELIAASSRILWINWYAIQAALNRAHEKHRARDGHGAETVARAADLIDDLNELFRLRGVRPYRGLARVLRDHAPKRFGLGLANVTVDSAASTAFSYSLTSALRLVPRPFHGHRRTSTATVHGGDRATPHARARHEVLPGRARARLSWRAARRAGSFLQVSLHAANGAARRAQA